MGPPAPYWVSSHHEHEPLGALSLVWFWKPNRKSGQPPSPRLYNNNVREGHAATRRGKYSRAPSTHTLQASHVSLPSPVDGARGYSERNAKAHASASPPALGVVRSSREVRVQEQEYRTTTVVFVVRGSASCASFRSKASTMQSLSAAMPICPHLPGLSPSCLEHVGIFVPACMSLLRPMFGDLAHVLGPTSNQSDVPHMGQKPRQHIHLTHPSSMYYSSTQGRSKWFVLANPLSNFPPCSRSNDRHSRNYLGGTPPPHRLVSPRSVKLSTRPAVTQVTAVHFPSSTRVHQPRDVRSYRLGSRGDGTGSTGSLVPT